VRLTESPATPLAATATTRPPLPSRLLAKENTSAEMLSSGGNTFWTCYDGRRGLPEVNPPGGRGPGCEPLWSTLGAFNEKAPAVVRPGQV
jgi:hypothetical protein